VRSALRRLRRRTLVVHLLSGQSLRGVLVEGYRDCIVLRHVTHLDEKADLQGEIVIPRERVDYYQTVEQG
jgi:hypothetical protein